MLSMNDLTIWNHNTPQPDANEYPWELNIAFNPSPENCAKAANALEKLFKKPQYAAIHYRSVSLEGTGADWKTYLKNQWVGPSLVMNAKMDEDQRGKEIRITLSNDKTPDFWKNLALQCWNALIEEGVEQLGYMSQVYGATTVNSDSGLLTPFTYQYRSPFHYRHGELIHRTEEIKALDPFRGTSITRDDLKQAKIPSRAVVNILNARKQHYQSLAEEVYPSLAAVLEQALAKAHNQADVLPEIDRQLTLEDYSKEYPLIEWITNHLPYWPNSLLREHPLSKPLREAAKLNHPQNIKKCLEQLKAFLNQERKLLVEDMNQLQGIRWAQEISRDEFNAETSFQETIENAVIKAPRTIQYIYRLHFHFQRQLEARAEAERQFKTSTEQAMASLERLGNIVRNIDYWKYQHSSHRLNPIGIVSLAMHFQSEVKALTTEEHCQSFYQQCRVIAQSRLKGHFFSTLKRHPTTTKLYQLLINAPRLEDLAWSDEFREFEQRYQQAIQPTTMDEPLRALINLIKNSNWKSKHGFQRQFPAGIALMQKLVAQYETHNGKFDLSRTEEFIQALHKIARSRSNKLGFLVWRRAEATRLLYELLGQIKSKEDLGKKLHSMNTLSTSLGSAA